MQIPVNAFRFCKITITAIIWCAFIFKLSCLVYLALIILVLSAILKIKRAPMVFLYSQTIEKLFPHKSIEINEIAMRFAHSLGAFLALICVIALLVNEQIGWWVVLGFAILKTLSMIGFCPGEAMYTCYKNGTCNIFRK